MSTGMGAEVVNWLSGQKLIEVLRYIRDVKMSAIINYTIIDMTMVDLILRYVREQHPGQGQGVDVCRWWGFRRLLMLAPPPRTESV